MKKYLPWLVAFISIKMNALATVTIQFEFSQLRDSSQTPFPVNTAAVLIADSNGDGQLPTALQLNNMQLNPGALVGGDSLTNADVIIFAGLTDADPEAGNFNGSINALSLATVGLNSGDIYGLYWFAGVNAFGPGVTVTAGQSYGYFRNSNLDTATVGFGGNSGMVIPQDGNSVNVQFYAPPIISEPTVNTPTISNFSANFTVIPEPSSLVLTLLGSAALLRRRRA